MGSLTLWSRNPSRPFRSASWSPAARGERGRQPSGEVKGWAQTRWHQSSVPKVRALLCIAVPAPCPAPHIAGTSPLRLCLLLRAASRVPRAAFCPRTGDLQPRSQGWGLTRRPSFSCPFSRLSRGKETMLFRFCTWKGQRRGRGYPRGVPASGAGREAGAPRPFQHWGLPPVKSLPQ